jgi:hypothetical protein
MTSAKARGRCPRIATTARACGAVVIGASLAASWLLASSTARAEPYEPPPYRLTNDPDEPNKAPALPPMTLPYVDGDRAIPGYHVEDRARRSYLALGGALFGSSYLVSAIVTLTVVGSKQPDAVRIAPLAIPVFGPFIALSSAHVGTAGAVPMSLDGVAQIAGVGLFAVGLAVPEKVLVFDTITARVVPTPGGAALVGTF